MSDKEKDDDLEMATGEETLSPEAQSESEAWHEELPPEDDFQDQTDFSEEALDDDASLDSEAPADQEGKRRGRNVFVAAIFVGVAILGAFVYLQFAPKAASTDGIQPIASVLSVKDINKPIAPSKPSTENEDSIPGLSGKTERVDMISLYHSAKNKGNQSTTAVLPTQADGEAKPDGQQDAEIVTSSIVAGDKVINENDNKQDEQIQKASQDDLFAKGLDESRTAKGPEGKTVKPTTGEEKKETTPLVAAQAQPAPESLPTESAKPKPVAVEPTEGLTPSHKDVAAKALEPVASSPVVDAAQAKRAEDAEKRLKELEAQMGALQKSLTEANEKNAQLVSKLETAAAEAASVKEKILDTKASQASAKVTKEEPIKAETAESKAVEPSVAEVVKEPMKAETKPVVQTTSTKKKAKKKEAKATTAKAASGKKEEKQKVAEGWVLRAVTPDSAWIATSPTDPELRQLSVGDDAPGIGIVKEITRKGDAWQVIGEKGVLK
jgi:hypothetical protein